MKKWKGCEYFLNAQDHERSQRYSNWAGTFKTSYSTKQNVWLNDVCCRFLFCLCATLPKSEKTSQEMNIALILQCTALWYLNMLYWKEDTLKYIFGSINFCQSFIWVGWAVALCQISLLTVYNPSGRQPGGGNIVQPHGVYISCLLRVNKPFSSEEKRECADLLRNTKVHPCLFRISTAGSKNLSHVLVC